MCPDRTTSATTVTHLTTDPDRDFQVKAEQGLEIFIQHLTRLVYDRISASTTNTSLARTLFDRLADGTYRWNPITSRTKTCDLSVMDGDLVEGFQVVLALLEGEGDDGRHEQRVGRDKRVVEVVKRVVGRDAYLRLVGVS